jgi:hypothetical protein
VKLNGVPISALLHTGCEHNFCGRRLIPDVSLDETSQRLFAANGTPVSLLGQTTIRIIVSGIFITVDVVVSDAIDELILGIPFLVQNHCFGDFTTSQVTIRGKTARLHDRPGRGKVRRVNAGRDVAILPSSVMDVPVIVTRPTLRQAGEQ